MNPAMKAPWKLAQRTISSGICHQLFTFPCTIRFNTATHNARNRKVMICGLESQCIAEVVIARKGTNNANQQ